jgi:hypothetical protein
MVREEMIGVFNLTEINLNPFLGWDFFNSGSNLF